jgi:aerobic-type carbon monoxide dehydrogenase small subunit (CoxS/CutS family)
LATARLVRDSLTAMDLARGINVFPLRSGNVSTGGTMTKITQIHVNGSARPIYADPDRSLLSVLRDDLGLTGTKYGCGEGQCGACTVLVEGKRVRSCVTRLDTVRGKTIRTVEDLAPGPGLHPVQQAFLDADALQCGYCTSGMIMSAVALLHEQPAPSREAIVTFMDKNICRCCAYPRIVAAIETAAKVMRGAGS